MSKKALERAVGLAGGQAELHRKLKEAGERVSQQAISLWLKAGQVGKGWAIPVAKVIAFEITPHELDKVNYPNPWDGLPLERARPLILELAA